VSLDRKTMQTIAALSDDAGVLSVYVTIDPRQEATSRPSWQVWMQNELAVLREELRRAGDRARLEALDARLAHLAPDLAAVLDPAMPGLGRALFAPLGRPEAHTVSVQLPLGTMIVLDPLAHVHPLLRAWHDGAPAGIAAVAGTGVRVVDHRFGLAKEVAQLTYEQATEDWRELTGPAAPIPGRAQHSAPQRDLFARRVAVHLTRFLGTTGARLAALATELEWTDLVLTGDAELVAATAAGLPRELTAAVLTAPHLVASLSPTAIAEAVRPQLSAARRARDRELVSRARDAALGGGAAAYGLADTLSALAEGRVAHLLLDRDRTWCGQRAPDGRLCPDDEVLPGTLRQELSPEPRLGERMIESALRQGGTVTLLDPESAAPVAAADGVAALLRW
jgi:hypothetical protein